jgi:hypothetical protein
MNVNMEHITKWGLTAYFSVLGAVVVGRATIFWGRFGRNHRLSGLFHLCWLFMGVLLQWLAPSSVLISALMYDFVLAVSGIVLTLTAAADFRAAHAHVANVASGALDESATITVGEMIEHAFYQGLNFAQILFLHALHATSETSLRLSLLALVTAPWVLRHRFPVNSFSANYSKPGSADSRSLIGILYRLKKYQYLLWKHVLFHGLNISVAVTGHSPVLHSWFRFFWIALNSSYVLEFFMQTLVKRKRLQQNHMLLLNQFLMFVSTGAALPVLLCVLPVPAVLSCLLNFVRRGHDFSNTLVVCVFALVSANYN